VRELTLGPGRLICSLTAPGPALSVRAGGERIVRGELEATGPGNLSVAGSPGLAWLALRGGELPVPGEISRVARGGFAGV